MNLSLILLFSLLLSFTSGQNVDYEDILPNIMTELKNLKEAQKECSNKLSNLDEYKSRVASLEKTVKVLQDTVKDLKRENKELNSEIEELAGKRGRITKGTTSNESIEMFRRDINNDDAQNAIYPLQGKIKKSRVLKKDDQEVRNDIRRSFTLSPTTSSTTKNPGNARVAFTATLSTKANVDLKFHHATVFNDVITNIGNAYDTLTGIFTAPVTGLYVFGMTIAHPSHEYALDLEMVKDGKHIYYIYVDGSYTETREILLNVQQGSQVWLRCISESQIRGFSESLFSGFLLFETV